VAANAGDGDVCYVAEIMNWAIWKTEKDGGSSGVVVVVVV